MTGRIAVSLAAMLAAGTALAPVARAQPVPPAATASTGLDANGHLLAVSLPANGGFSYARLREGVQLRHRENLRTAARELFPQAAADFDVTLD